VSVSSRLAALAAEYALPGEAPGRLAGFLDLLATDPDASTSVRDPRAGVDVHVADALSGLLAEPVRQAGVIADLGSGNGIPGLVLAIARPEARVVLVEAAQRKSAFLRRAVEGTGSANAEVVTGRAEDWRDGHGACDAVVARAIAPLPVLAEYAAPLLRVGGSLVAWKGERDATEEAAGAAAAEALGLAVGSIVSVRPFPKARNLHLHLFQKVAPTPERFPRRAGMAVKRPLGSSSSDRRRR
jgi:16S rRNA (guanine527-N7)-methyltransferase